MSVKLLAKFMSVKECTKKILNELSHPYSEMWDSDVVFILHQCIPLRKMF